LLPDRLTQIDNSNRGAHHFLEVTDSGLYFFGEYHSHRGYDYGETNNLIHNLKKKPSAVAGRANLRRYKEGAICQVGEMLRKVIRPQDGAQFTWVPIPPSKALDHPDYDDRLFRALQHGFRGYNFDIRPLLRQTQTTEADHGAANRMSPGELEAVLEVDQASLNVWPARQAIVLFDDVLTTGKHFKCCQRKIWQVLPGIPIIGIFVARRVLPNPFADFEPLGD
jgi:hypothetical protein